jgi:hypothetical protein
MKKIICLLAILSLSALPEMMSIAFADAPNGGSDACGLGWEVTKQKTLIGTLTRATTNAFLDPTWSMTSGTSGCSKHAIAKNDEEAVKYVASNFYPLTAEMADGQGEYLVGLAQVMGCNDAVISDFNQATQKSFNMITDNADAYQTVQNVKQVVRQNPVLSKNCVLMI